jgi:lipoprotein-anchoring transpeptidase ErfK/SrfK
MKKMSLFIFTIVIFTIITISLFIFFLSKKNTKIFDTPTTTSTSTEEQSTLPTNLTATTTTKKYFDYLEIVNSCGISFNGTCVNMRSSPSKKSKVVDKLRTGIVLQISDTITNDEGVWYKIKVDQGIMFPERAAGGWYVAAGDYISLFKDEGVQDLTSKNKATSTKYIVVDISEQMLYAYDDKILYMKTPVSTGLTSTPTPRGTFTIFKKTPSRYMQGPLKGVSEQYYDLPGVPWDLYFTADGAVIHGAYWHNSFGQKWSHGCVNLSPEESKKLYSWADLGIPVIVKN